MERLRVCAEIHRCRERNRAASASSCPETSFQDAAQRRKSYDLPTVTDQHLKGRRMDRGPWHHDDLDEDEYHYVDDPETTHHIQILPSKPLISAAGDYADRCIYPSAFPQPPASSLNKGPNTPPRLPKRCTQGPSVNRSLKPGVKEKSQPSGERNHHAASAIQDFESPPRLRSKMHGFPARDTQNLRQQHHERPQTRGDIKTFGHQAKPRSTQNSDDQSWYVGPCERAEAEQALHITNTDGAFLVRDHSRSCAEEPFVLSLLFQGRVFNVKIRFIKSSRKYALGTGLWTSDVFDSVDAIIKFHMVSPILLIDGKDQSVQRKCTLTYPLTKEDVNKISQRHK
ncbi:hypothetical protein GJAV_G00167940 [Gymnothorax javanicus]|nr:hypothetical protein GJAV_G00167940 [Gymnothorax javanicus]